MQTSPISPIRVLLAFVFKSMANDKQLKILKQGVEVWNRWRKEHPEEAIDLRQANLRETHLRQIDLQQADLYKALFMRADLREANLTTANLRQANCYEARLSGACLDGVQARWAVFRKADLTDATLIGADLKGITCIHADLSRADLSGTQLYGSSRDDWEIHGIRCDYVFWDQAGTERTPKDRDFRPGEFEELYKSLPTIEYYFEHGFTPVDAVLMDKVVQAVNEQHPDFELRLDSFHSRGQPHAVFTVLHTEQAENALQQVRQDYEARIQQLQGKEEALLQVIDMLSSRPQNIELVLGDKRMITTGRGYHEQTDGDTIITP